LPRVGGCCGSSWNTRKDTLDIGERGRIRAALCIRVQSGISLEVEIESNTSSLLVTKACALVGVIAIEVGVAHVR
jgi:hypothetical protein